VIATLSLSAVSAATQPSLRQTLEPWMVKETASKPLDHPRGSKFEYSNLGYVIAGAVLERMSGKTWEELVREQIVEPLELKSAGFGPQSSLGRVDAPLGHLMVNGKLKPMLAGPNGDNPL